MNDNVQIAFDEMNDEREIAVKKEAEKRANKIVKKHRKEIARLMTLAEKAIIEDNKDSYIYAIAKLRRIYKQPYNSELLDAMWTSTRNTIISML